MNHLAGSFAPDSCASEQFRREAISFDGRLDNRTDLLRRRPIASESNDAMVALSAYEAGGEAGLGELVGDWSAVISDPARRRIVLASDYAGARPLYYQYANGRLHWESSLPRLLAITGGAELDDDYLREFLTVEAPFGRTPYRGVCVVPPGHALVAGAGGCSLMPIWRLTPCRPLRLRDEHEYVECFRALFEEAVGARLRTSGPVYAELSGGLDSSAIAAVANKLIAEGRVEAKRLVTVTYRHAGSSDEKFCRLVEQSLGLEALHIDVSEYPFIAADATGQTAPHWWETRYRAIARRMQSDGANVFLTGQLGDLVMGNWIDDSEQVGDLVRSGSLLRAFRASLDWSVACQRPLYSILRRALQLNLPWPFAGDRRSTGEDSLRPPSCTAPPEDDLWKPASPGRQKHYREIGRVLRARSLQPPEPLGDIFYTHPYSHRPLVEFMLSIPPEVVARPGEPRSLMRRALAGLVPAPVLARRSKASFQPVFATALRPLAAELLGNIGKLLLEQRGIIDGADLKSRLQHYLRGIECNAGQLRLIILLEFWLRNREMKAEPVAASVTV